MELKIRAKRLEQILTKAPSPAAYIGGVLTSEGTLSFSVMGLADVTL